VSFEGPQFGISECIYSFSKTMSGKATILKKEKNNCEEPKCISLKIMQDIVLGVRSNSECDSEKAKTLDGNLIMRLIQGLIDTGEGRGAHHGSFRWAGTSDTFVIGQLRGITNAGTHHKPLKECEKCNIKGHMEGQLNGTVYNTKDIGIMDRLLATYAFEFKTGVEFRMDMLQGTIEGVIISLCKL
jgi:hypothetical protein